MDQSFLLMLSNLLHLHNYLDPTTSPLLSSATLSSSAADATSTSAAPLLFFTLASVLSYLASHPPAKKKPKTSSSASPSSAAGKPPSEFSVAAFRALSTEHIWSMEAPLRDAQWQSLYGLSYPVFTTIVEKLKPYITQSQLSLPSDYAVAMVLSRLAHGLSLKTLASRYALEPYLISKITNMVTRLLATKLYAEFVKIPVRRERLVGTTQGFQELTLLPNICGAIDTTPVKLHRLRPDVINGSMYYCKYGFPSVLLQVVADHKKRIWDVCVKAPGGYDDADHFRDSLLYNNLISGDLVWDKGVSVRGQPVRPYIIGDWSFPLLSFLLTPFSYNRTGSPAQNAFDEALMKGRKSVEEAIGLLKGRWKILQDLNVGLNHAPQTIVACCVLHNLCQIAGETEPEPWKEPEESGQTPRVLENEKPCYYYGEKLRQVLADDLYQRLSSR
ncbi:PIF / Ping-Pong family of plant transposase [Perilla frutescens var. hirtella]|uniref:PIF / Ping-Pong family of plant transposase n=1 Tax=Perilla frutescens var. hirtella TaxID=608512 RepID=A0AAD4J2L3_PERFH|nr:PIF / Ping-Pong family of plant transposase [Perilla frutescens var. frutescens]KAH6794070.1 PIF / Ping-Pong family of plant transposase [Perilla frutescens var. hirtella]KAH6825937.1 PIF / Ping-Pong family of plant transposase [Perilla frutescens var. hirtella]